MNIPASYKYLSPARLAISGLANQAKFSVQEIEEIKRAFSDACKMAINHAYQEDIPDKHISIECSLSKKALDLKVKNSGLKIDLQKKIHP